MKFSTAVVLLASISGSALAAPAMSSTNAMSNTAMHESEMLNKRDNQAQMEDMNKLVMRIADSLAKREEANLPDITGLIKDLINSLTGGKGAKGTGNGVLDSVTGKGSPLGGLTGGLAL